MQAVVACPYSFGDQPRPGGGERYALNLALGVAVASAEQWSVEIVSLGDGSHRTIAPGVTLTSVRADSLGPLDCDGLSWGLLDPLARADLVHVHHPFTRFGQQAVLVAKLFGKPVVATHHSLTTVPPAEVDGLLRLVDRVTCYSRFGASSIQGPAPVEVIPGGVDTDWFRPPPSDTGRDRFLYVGRLAPRKGVDRLIAALPPELPLTVCWGTAEPRYLDLLGRLARGKQVVFVRSPSDAELLALYQSARAVVLPSVHVDVFGDVVVDVELMGLAPLEGMACGVPAVVARSGALPEFVVHGETGVVFDTDDELRTTLRRLAADAELCHRLGRRAREMAEASFSHRVAGAAMLELYRKLAPGPPPDQSRTDQ